jgi:hypothetical protein
MYSRVHRFHSALSKLASTLVVLASHRLTPSMGDSKSGGEDVCQPIFNNCFNSSVVGNFTAISLMHESGTGGEPKYGVVSQTPLAGDLNAQGINVANNWTYLVRLWM